MIVDVSNRTSAVTSIVSQATFSAFLRFPWFPNFGLSPNKLNSVSTTPSATLISQASVTRQSFGYVFDDTGSEQQYSLITVPDGFGQPAHADTAKSLTTVSSMDSYHPHAGRLKATAYSYPLHSVYPHMLSETIMSD